MLGLDRLPLKQPWSAVQCTLRETRCRVARVLHITIASEWDSNEKNLESGSGG
jgi:hypothetical protein